jgi:hypothetical protein
MSRVQEAQSKLQKFPQLQSLVGRFSTLEIEDKIRNIFLNFCVEEREELADFEAFLSSFRVLSWPRKKLDRFRSRVLANNWEESMSALAEGVITRYYSKRLGIGSVERGPAVETGKLSDIKLDLGGREIFLEITSVGTGLFEQKLETAFDETCKTIIPMIDGNRFVDIIVDSTKLPVNPQGHLDVDETILLLNKYVVELKLVTLFNSSISPLTIDVENIASLPEKTIYELAAEIAIPNTDLNWLQFLYPRMWEQLSDEEIAKWAKTIRPSMAQGCPVVYFGASDGDFAGVQIQDRKRHPSPSSKLEIKSFLTRVDRVLEDKIAGGQLQPGSPNIIVIRAHNWLSHGYEDSRDFLALDFDAIENAVKKTLSKMENHHIACVSLYESDYGKARIITNEHADPSSHLSEVELSELGLNRTFPLESASPSIGT